MSLPAKPGQSSWRLDKLLLLAVAALAGAALLATPHLIKPFPDKAPWYESAAFFPRAALVLVIVGALVEWLLRRRTLRIADSEELDSSQVRIPLALTMLALFVGYALAVPWLGFMVSTALFLLLSGVMLELPWRQALAIALPTALILWAVFVKLLKVAFGHGLLF